MKHLDTGQKEREHDLTVVQPVAAIKAERLSLAFEEGGERVLHDASVTLGQGELLLLLGPSGGGKSSLALCLNGIYPHAVDSVLSGAVKLYGETLAKRDPGEIAQTVGIVFQDVDSQFCMLRVEEELAFCLENVGVPSQLIDERIREALETADLADYRDAYIHTLSGGMKQRLALACALALKPRVLILDEPSSNLDPASTVALARLIRQIQQQSGMTILLIEHQLDAWMADVDRLAVLNSRGSIIYEGEPRTYFMERRGGQ